MLRVDFHLLSERDKRAKPGKLQKTGYVRLSWYRRALVRTDLQWKSNNYYIFWVCVCSISYPACTAHATYFSYVAWLWKGVHIILKNDFRGGGKLLNTKLLNFLYSCCWNIAHFKKRARYDKKCILAYMYSTPLFLSDFNETANFSQQIFGKYRNTRLHGKSVQWGLSCSMRTDRRTWRS